MSALLRSPVDGWLIVYSQEICVVHDVQKGCELHNAQEALRC